MFFFQVFFIHQPEIINDRIICSFTISLSCPRTHPLSSLSPFFYICSWLGNKTPQETINNPISLLLSYVRHFSKITALFIFSFWKALISKIFQNILKIFLNRNSSVYFENIVVCDEPFKKVSLNIFLLKIKQQHFLRTDINRI